MNNDLPAPTRDDLQGNGHASASAGDEIGSDSDSSISEESDSPQYYQPIPSAADEEELTAVSESESESGSHHHPLSNGGVYAVSSSVSSLDLNESGEEEEEERMREEASNMAAIRRAFREDESRRSAPLPPENAVRVMEAMRGVTFPPQSTPLWAHRVPEDRWIHHLLTIRTPGCFDSNQ